MDENWFFTFDTLQLSADDGPTKNAAVENAGVKNVAPECMLMRIKSS